MKKIVSIITTIIIVVLLILFIILPKNNFSNNENRYLEKFPKISVESIFDGTYMKKFESYVEDHFPFREFFLSLKTNVFKLSGITKQSDVYFGKAGYLLQQYNNPENEDKIIRIVNRFVSSNDNVNFDFLLVPTSVYVNSDKLPKNSINSNEKETIEYYSKKIKTNFIDISETLLENNEKYLYYRTDHHWTTYGAEVAYLEYCKNKGLVAKKFDYELVDDNFYGTLYSKVIDNSLEQDSIYRIKDDNLYDVYYKDKDKVTNSFYEESYLKNKDKYSYFLDNNHDLIVVTNNSAINNDELLIIKDSYANAFVPFVASHYKKLHIIDPRYYKNNITW